MPFKHWLTVATRILIGIVFITSAITKLVSIDSFEVFLYSFEIIHLNVAFILARLIISLELLIGILFILKIYLKPLIYSTLSLLFLFTLFLVFLLITKNPEDCKCFGDLVSFSHLASILKNSVLILMLFVIIKTESIKIKYQQYILTGSLILSLLVTVIVSPPDFIYKKKYEKNVSYNSVHFDEFIQQQHLPEDKMVICFYSVKCRFCKLAAKKISVLANKTNAFNNIYCVFWGDKSSVENFYKETNTTSFKSTIIPRSRFLRITEGKMPVIVLINKGDEIGKYGYRTIDESEIINFLENN